MIDLFDMFGIQFEEPEKEEKKAAAKKSSKKTGKKTSPAAKAAKSTPAQTFIKLPVTVYTGYEPAHVVDTDVFGGKSEVSEKELREKIAEFLQIAPNLLAVRKLDGTKTLMAGIKPVGFQAKGDMTLDAGWKLKLGNKIWPLGGALEETLSLEELNAKAAAVIPVLTAAKFSYWKNQNVLHVVPAMPNAEDADLAFPVRCFSFANGKFEVTDTEYCEFAAKDQEEGEDVEPTELSVEGLKAYIVSKYPEFKLGCRLQIYKEMGIILVVPDTDTDESLVKSSGSTVSVEKKYPTEGTRIKFGWASYPLTSEMFGGKKEVTEADLLEYLAEDYPEYSKDRTKFEYDKERGIIIPILTGGKKGARLTLDEEGAIKMVESGNAIPFNYLHEGKKYLVINHPVALLAYDQEATVPILYWELNVPKISYKAFADILEFFREVHHRYDTEAFVRVFYHPEEGYSLEVPSQSATPSSVDYEAYNPKENDDRILVAELHSHNRYPAFWSGTDDRDEKGYRIYGVVGNLDKEALSVKFRFGVGGKFFDLQAPTAFISSMDKLEEETDYQPLDMEEALEAFIE